MAKKKPAGKSYRITGQVIDKTSHQGLPGLRVEAWDKGRQYNDLVGSAVTDEKGGFQMEFTEEYFRECFRDRRPDLYFRVFHNKQLIGSTENTVLWNIKSGPAALLMEVDLPAEAEPPKPGSFVVKGLARYPHGALLVGAVVKAFDKDLRSEELLGETLTDKSGHYEIAYSAEKFRRAEKASADLIVRAYDKQGKELAASGILFNAPAVAEVDLVVGNQAYRGPSEYELLLKAIAPLLQGLSPADLIEDETHQDISFLAGETGHERQHIELLAEAARLARPCGIPVEAFYGWFREGLPHGLEALERTGRSLLESALERAVTNNIIPEYLLDKRVQFIERLQAYAAERVFKDQDGVKPSLGQLLETTELPQPSLQRFLEKSITHEGSAEELWEALRQDEQFGAEGVEQLQFTLQLGLLTGNQIPLVRWAQSERKAGRINQFRDLAQLSQGDWERAISDAKADADPKQIASTLEELFPGDVARHKLARHEGYKNHTGLLHFLQTNGSNFDLVKDNIGLFEKKNGEKTFEGVQDKEAVKREIKRLHRALRIAPKQERFETAVKLLEKGFDSAARVARMGKGAFARKHGEALGGKERALEIHRRASHRAAMALSIYGQYGAAFRSVRVIGDWIRDVDDIPNWNKLFGPPAQCECEHCRSMFGPAAYLFDLLDWLKGSVDAQAPYTDGLDVLFHVHRDDSTVAGRRADIGDIELSCENSHTPVPYVDLVLEVLENAVAPFIPFGFFITEADVDVLNAERIPGQVRTMFGPGVLSERATISVRVPGKQWFLYDGGRGYRISKAPNDPPRVSVHLSQQTRATADELGAEPEYVNQQAYTQLATAKYPWNLPFDLATETARVFLQHLGLPRYRLMEAFHANPEPSAVLTDQAIVGECLGLTPTEWSAIATSPSTEAERATFWGLLVTVPSSNPISDPFDPNEAAASGDWYVVLSRVSIFLQRSGLTYKELLELLDTRFVNGGRHLQIAPRPAPRPGDEIDPLTCNVSKLEIRGLNSDSLEKIHRFIRLQRKLGWAIRDLDRAIMAFTPPAAPAPVLDEEFLVQISHVSRLHERLGVPLIRLLNWWAPKLDTAIYEVEQEKGIKPFYEQLFLNRSALNPEDEAFLLNEHRTELRITGNAIMPVAGAVRAALQLSESDFALLMIDATVPDPADVRVPDELTLKNLTKLFRTVSLCKALRLSIKDFTSARVLAGIDPFTQTQNALLFVDAVETIRASGFSIEQLDYLLRHNTDGLTGFAPTDQAIAETLTEIRDELNRISQEPVPIGNTAEDVRQALLDRIGDDTIVNQVLAVIQNGNVRETDDEVNTGNSAIAAAFSPFLSTAVTEIQAALVGAVGSPPPLEALPARFGYVFLLLRLYDRLGDLSSASQAMALLRNGGVRPDEAAVSADNAVIDRAFASFLSTTALAAAKIALVGSAGTPGAPPSLTEPAGRFAYVLERLAHRLLGEGLIIQKLAEALQLEVRAMELFLRTTPAAGVPAIVVFAEGLPPRRPVDRTSASLAFEAFIQLHKASAIASRLSLTADEIGWLVAHQADGRWLNFTTLPASPDSAYTRARFDAWVRLSALAGLLVRLARLRSPLSWEEWDGLRAAFGPAAAAVPPPGPALFALFDLAGQTPVSATDAKRLFLEALGGRAGWRPEDIEFLAGTVFRLFSAGDPDDLRIAAFRLPGTATSRLLERLDAACHFLNRIGSTARAVNDWTAPSLTAVSARSVMQAVRAKYNEERWPAVAKPIRDGLREKQRAALVSYLVAREGLRDAYGLYQFLLIDPEMDPCMMTSRIRQAISAVQLFVQRALMGLEPGMSMDEDDKLEWEWRKNYRVWEANRKVFLYPENWIYPELRDDKSQFFKELESELLQDEITDKSAERMYLNYLDKLSEVARLDIAGLYYEEDGSTGRADETTEILHVFGRTPNTPHRYYYRRWISRSYWTPWERVELDIEGDHLIPLVPEALNNFTFLSLVL